MSNHNSMAKQATKQATKIAMKGLSLKAKLIIGSIAIGAVLLFLILMGVVSSVLDSQNARNMNHSIDGFGTAQVSEQVLRYRSDIESELAKYGKTEYTDLLLALMQQESGGRGNDPMQASESKCGYIGCITNPQESIRYGVKHFVNVLEKANHDVKLTLQSYNFGGGFIDFVMANGGAYTKDLAIKFSQKMYQQLAHTGIYRCHRPSAIANNACYGDIEYVDAVLKYLPATVANGSIEAMGDAFNTVFSEMKKYEGFPYTFGGNSPATSFDCSSLMQWGFKMIGVNLPRTAQEQYDAVQKINANELKAGDLVFFTGTYNAGRAVTHVGMYIGNGMMYDANSGGIGFSNINDSYWRNHLYGYGRVVDFS